MKKTLLLSLAATAAIVAGGDIAPVEPNVAAPVVESNNDFGSSVALIGGFGVLAEDNLLQETWKEYYGVAVSAPCLLLDGVTNDIELVRFENELEGNRATHDAEFYELTVNPKYNFNLGGSTVFGIGPSFGVLYGKAMDTYNTVVTYGVAASIKQDITEDIFAGVEAKYMMTDDWDLAGNCANGQDNDQDLANGRVQLMVGYRF